MNFAAVLGFLFSIGIATYAVLDAAKNPKLFLNGHAIIIVLGGTLTVGLLSFSFKRLFGSLGVLVRKMFGSSNVKEDYNKVILQIVDIANLYRDNPKAVLGSLNNKTHPFLMDGMKLLLEYGFNAEELDGILENAIAGKKKRDHDEVKVWHTLSRFPPAFGLLGATLGMIALLETLGEPGSQDRIGPAMATALVATFYGLIAANLVLIPIAERLTEVAAGDIVMRNIIKKGVILVAEKKHPSYIEEYLKSFLPPRFRGESTAGTGKPSNGRSAKAA